MRANIGIDCLLFYYWLSIRVGSKLLFTSGNRHCFISSESHSKSNSVPSTNEIESYIFQENSFTIISTLSSLLHLQLTAQKENYKRYKIMKYRACANPIHTSIEYFGNLCPTDLFTCHFCTSKHT